MSNPSILLLSLTALVIGLCSCSSQESTSTSQAAAEAHSDGVAVPHEVAKQMDMKVEKIETRVLGERLHLTGHVNPDIGKETDVEARFSGRVISIHAQLGDTVYPGQTLLEIESHEVSELQAELIEARSKLMMAKAHEERERQVYEENLQRPQTLIEARTIFDRTNVALSLAEAEYKRVEGLRLEKIASEKDFLATKANLEQATLAHKEASQRLKREEALFKNKGLLRKDLQLAEAERAREQQHVNTLKQRLENIGMPADLITHVMNTGKIAVSVPLRSRVAGVLTQQDVALGDLVGPGKRLFTTTDLSTVIVNIDIPEVDLKWIKQGQKATISIASYAGETFTGVVSYLSDTVSPQTRTVAGRVRLDNRSRRLKLNMFAEIDILADPKSVVACPRSAVQERDGQKIVFVRESDDFVARKVELGADTEQYFEVLSGLRPGEEVVTQGSLLLKTEMTYKQ